MTQNPQQLQQAANPSGMGTPENILISSFDGGMHLQLNPLLIQPNEARVAKNVDLDEIGTLKKCKGYSAFGDQPTTDPILALYSFYKLGTTTTRYLLRDSGGSIYQYDFGTNTWTSKHTGLSSTALPTWLTYNNLAIRFNGVDNPLKFDGTTFSDLGGNPPNGNVAALYKDRIYVAGVDPHYSTLYFSDIGNPEKYPPANNESVNNNDGDRIMALTPLFDSLLIFKEYSIWEWQVDRLNNPSFVRYITKDIGTTSARSVLNINGIVYFFNRSGVWMLSQKYPELISLKVDKIIKSIKDPYSVVAFKDGNKYNLFVGDVTIDDRVFKNTILVYDTVFNQWTIKCLNDKAETITDFIDDNNILTTYFGNESGQAFKWNDGYSFNGKPIEMEYETAMFQPGDPRYRKLFSSVLVRIDEKPNSAPTIAYSIDHRNWVDMGEAANTYSNMPITDMNKLGTGREEGNDITLRIHEVSTQEMKPVYQIVIYFTERKTNLRIH